MKGTVAINATTVAIETAKHNYVNRLSELEAKCVQPTIDEIAAHVKNLMDKVEVDYKDFPKFKRVAGKVAKPDVFDKAIRELQLKQLNSCDVVIPVGELSFDIDSLLDAHEKLQIHESAVSINW